MLYIVAKMLDTRTSPIMTEKTLLNENQLYRNEYNVKVKDLLTFM